MVGKWLNVVGMQCDSMTITVSITTVLAGIIISLEYRITPICPCLACPQSMTFGAFATLPCGAIRATFSYGYPSPTAFKTTK
jgi:hypothetical protein